MDTLVSFLVAAAIIGFFMWNYLRKEKKREEKARAAAEKGKLYSEGPRSQHPHIDANYCIGCAACTMVCPEGDVLAMLGGNTGSTPAVAQRLPNFIIVYADDMGYADIGPFSTKTAAARPQTPNLDRMASEGIRLTDFYVAQAVCSASRAAFLTGRFPQTMGIYGALGPSATNGVDTILPLLDDPHCIALGECGLDYHYDHSPREAQRDAFAAQVAVAHERDLPLVIHTREAWEHTFDILGVEGVPARTIFHCFTGGPDEAAVCLSLGAFLSFSGIVTFKTATDLQEAARRCPLDRLLVETDSPYLAPVPFRGKRNEPAYLIHVVEAVAALKDLTVDEVASASVANARVAFRLDRP